MGGGQLKAGGQRLLSSREPTKMVHFTPPFSVFLLALLASGRADTQHNDKSHNQFALDFYQAMRHISPNIVASPLSLEIILAMAQQGAGGTTAEEISKVLHHAGNHSEVLGAYKALIQELQKKPELKMATKMFVEKSFNIHPDFQNISTTNFLSTVQGIDFKGNPEGSRKEINDWVDNNTNHKIKDLFSEGSVNPDIKLVLVNAIHFKAKWMNQFNANNTRDELFHITPTQAVTVKMMAFHGALSFTYSDRLKAMVLEIPYEEKDFRMIIILPYDYDGLAEVESKLTSADDFSELHQLQNGNIDVQLPRFKLEETMDLESILQKMGMPAAFTDLADFSKISNESLKISKVTQKAFIEVNEEGTEAAAATGAGLLIVSAPPQVHCNHPFMYMILKGNKILFIGRLAKPDGQVIDSPVKKQFE